jgi:hypothetical protein
MIVGLDLDNTIVDCDVVFHQQTEILLGRSLGQQPRETLRDLVRRERGDKLWTQIQAEVYGPLYQTCRPYRGAIEAIARIEACAQVSEIIIISHKTVTDSAGKNYKLRDYAASWIEKHLLGIQTALTLSHVHFAPTIEDKRQTIVAKKCDIFLDDLTDIVIPLQDKIRHPILFSPNASSHSLRHRLHVCDWPSFGAFVCRD